MTRHVPNDIKPATLLALFLLSAPHAIAHPDHSGSLRKTPADAAEWAINSPPAESQTNRISVSIEGDHRIILANGLPDHPTGMFPNRGNPNRIDTHSPLQRLRSGYRVKPGTRPDGPGGKYDGSFAADYEYVKEAGDLDKCNGRTGVTPEFPQGTYYYVLTDDFPFIPRIFKGTPDQSFSRKRPGSSNSGARVFQHSHSDVGR